MTPGRKIPAYGAFKSKATCDVPKTLPIDCQTHAFETHVHEDSDQANMDIQALISFAATKDYMIKCLFKGEAIENVAQNALRDSLDIASRDGQPLPEVNTMNCLSQ